MLNLIKLLIKVGRREGRKEAPIFKFKKNGDPFLFKQMVKESLENELKQMDKSEKAPSGCVIAVSALIPKHSNNNNKSSPLALSTTILEPITLSLAE